MISISKTLLITGGTGSFGNAVLRRFLQTEVAQIRVFSRDEKKQDEMRHNYSNPKLKFYLGDVRNRDSVREAVDGVDQIFHAAALKQVPSCEFYPMEAVQTNVIGTDNVLKEGIAAGVKSIVVLSTDKAAYPINAMGISKAMMEKVAVANSRVGADHGTNICLTRYGNVMASRGSVIPLFLSQIAAGLPLSITNPDMTRFMMTLDDAVDLVLHALQHGKPGDLYVQKAPAATIGTLAQALIELLQVKTPIKVIGTRHGEKLYETLLTREERAKAEDQGDYFRVSCDNRDLNYNLYYDVGQQVLPEFKDYNSHNTTRLDVPAMKTLLLKLSEIRFAMSPSARHTVAGSVRRED